MNERLVVRCTSVGGEAVIAHGGAGGWSREKSRQAIEAVRKAVEKGIRVLRELRDPLDAVAAAVRLLEDSGVLNAGRGSILTLNGIVEMDAGLMDNQGVVGAVAAVRRILNPILAALVVARETPHVLMAGAGAEKLAESFGVGQHPGPLPERVAQAYRRLREQRNRLFYHLWLEKVSLVPGIDADTVGAVARYGGLLAAGTSTGGISFKLEGRVGDSPVPGAGFYTGKRIACSATGIGETILADMLCMRIVERGEELGLRRAVPEVLGAYSERHPRGSVGVITVSSTGEACIGVYNAAMPYAIATGDRIEAGVCGSFEVKR